MFLHKGGEPLTDEKIVRGLKRKNTDALAELMERYDRYVAGIIGQLLQGYGTAQDVEELMADVFLAVWNASDRLDLTTYSSLKGYLGTVARNKAKDFLRKKKLATLALDDDILVFSDSVEKKFLQKEQQTIVKKALDRLSAEDRDIFIRYYYHYEKVSDIALQIAMNEQTVKSRLARGRKFLKRVLMDDYGLNE